MLPVSKDKPAQEHTGIPTDADEDDLYIQV